MEETGLPLRSEEVIDILMHRESHFGGSFSVMLDYYEKNGKGMVPEFTVSHIRELAQMEKESGQNLAGMMLSGAEAEKISRVRQKYKHLRTLYEKGQASDSIPVLVADLILTEEMEPTHEIEALVAKGKVIVPFLLELLRTEDYYDPHFPGYGQAPMLAARCLGRLGDTRAIGLLFQMIGEDDFYNEEAALKALNALGEPAREFLLKAVNSKPYSRDNERAAIALANFPPDPKIALHCFELLRDPDVQKLPTLALYLVLSCASLPQSERTGFLKMSQDPHLSPQIRQEMALVARFWEAASTSPLDKSS